MDLREIQVCESTQPYHVERVASASDRTRIYEVVIPPEQQDNPNEWICNCTGFSYRGRCRHIKEAYYSLCRWTADDPNTVQTTRQKQDHICPQCGGPTLEMVVIR